MTTNLASETPRHPRWRREAIFDLLWVGFVALYALVGMRNFDLRMATLHSDDGPILYAQAFKNPELFAGDIQVGAPMLLRLDLKVVTSVMIWIPSLWWKYLDVDPYAATWWLTLLQGASLGIAIYLFSLTIVPRRAVAILAALFVYIATPSAWTLANYGGGPEWNFTPYPAHWVIAPGMLAFACVLRRKDGAALVLLALSGLIHPGLALHACAIVGLYWLWEGGQTRFSPPTVYRLAGLALVVGVTLAPSLWVQFNLPGVPLPRAEVIAGMRQNQHLWPWSDALVWPASISETSKWLILAVLSWRALADLPKEFQRLWLSAVGAVAALGLSQVIGAITQTPSLLTLLGLRSFSWLALLAVPLIVNYWHLHFRSGHWPGAVLSALCIGLPLYAAEQGLAWPLIAGLLLIDLAQGCFSIWRFNLPAWGRGLLWVAALSVLLAWGIVFLALPLQVNNPVLNVVAQLVWPVHAAPPAWPERAWFVGVSAGLGLVAWGVRRLTPSPISGRLGVIVWPTVLGLTLYGGYFLWAHWQQAEQLSVSSLTSTLEVQRWAREHTSPSALFVNPESNWRTMSLRRQFEPFTRESYAYIAPREAKEHRDRLLAFYGFTPEQGETLRGYGPGGLFDMELERFRHFAESDFLRFASEFGATHLVLPMVYTWTERIDLALPLVYENPYYRVYELKLLSASDCPNQIEQAASGSHSERLTILMEAGCLDSYAHYDLPFQWQGPETFALQDLREAAPPLDVTGYRGEFVFSHLKTQGGDVLHVSPIITDTSGAEHIVQFGLWLRGEESAVEIQPGERVVLSLWAQRSAPGDVAEVFIEDETDAWEVSTIPMNNTDWQHYTVVRQIRAEATQMVFGVSWQANMTETWLEVKDLQVWRLDSSR